jgi:phosphate transport system permease protein
VIRIVVPEAFPGILTGGILAVGRAAGAVAPILFTGAVASMPHLPQTLTDRFMDLGYYVFILSTQGPAIEKTRPILFATVMVLLLLTFALNAVAILIRARLRARRRTPQ